MTVATVYPVSTEFQKIVERALGEDLHAGDVTAAATVPARTERRAWIETREDIVVCGLSLVAQVFKMIDPALRCTFLVEDGSRVVAGQRIATLEGDARALLAGERTALNLLQRACAVASKTAEYVARGGGKLRITDTRKTMPGLRALDRYAVRCGGGHNHRNDLGAGVLIKENHIRCAGSLEIAIQGALEYAPHTLRVCCEVESLDDVSRAVEAGADALLLDNMDDDMVREAVALVAGRAFVEVSGGITLERIPRLAASGADAVSVGALTHSAAAVDLSMLME
jgi:nicotinate-nucleotide pyrophosphorylase (carboxylating)